MRARMFCLALDCGGDPGSLRALRRRARTRRASRPTRSSSAPATSRTAARQPTSATAALLDLIDGTVFTAGDNAYPLGRAVDFANCYEPTWGRHRTRTRPSPGNHDYYSLAGRRPVLRLLRRLRRAAGAVGYYSYNLGAWHIVSLNSNVAAPGRLRPGAVVARRPRGEPDAVHARVLAPSALQLGPTRQRSDDAGHVSGAVRSRRGRGRHRPRSRLRAVPSAERRRRGGPERHTPVRRRHWRHVR